MTGHRALPYSSVDYHVASNRDRLIKIVQHIALHSLQPASINNYTRHIRSYYNLCNQMQITAIPASATSLCLFYAHHLITGHAITSIPGMQSAIKKHQTLLSLPFLDKVQADLVSHWMRGATKMFPHVPRRKRPLTLDVLLLMSHRCDESLPLNQMRLTMAFLAHDALLRFSEMSSLRVKDVIWKEGLVYLIIRDSKMNKGGPPEIVCLAGSGPHSAAGRLTEYWNHHHLHEADPESFLFPSVSSPYQPYDKNRFIEWVRLSIAQCGLDSSHYTGHSFRSGGATDLFNRRLPLRLIQLAGRWKSQAYLIYCRDHPKVGASAVAEAFQQLVSESLPFQHSVAGS
jgi:integrase